MTRGSRGRYGFAQDVKKSGFRLVALRVIIVERLGKEGELTAHEI